jgi:hypothetical protein
MEEVHHELGLKPAESAEKEEFDSSEERTSPDQTDERYATTQTEIYAYYGYANHCLTPRRSQSDQLIIIGVLDTT